LGAATIIKICRQFFVQPCSEHSARAISQSAVAGHCVRRRWNFEVLERLEGLTPPQIRKVCSEPPAETYRVFMFGKGFAVKNSYANEGKQLSVLESPGGPIGQKANAACALVCSGNLPA
jgi:hypothetical protein